MLLISNLEFENEERKRFHLASEDSVLFIVALLGLVVMWFLPAALNLKIAFVLLCIGIFFDLMSLFYHLMTIIIGKYMSGFPVVGLLFYALFILSSQFSLVGWNETSYARIALYKIADALVLLTFTYAVSSRCGFKNPAIIMSKEVRRNLTTHSTGARVSAPFIVNLNGIGVVSAPG